MIWYDLRRIFDEILLDLVASMKRNLKRHEAEEEKEGFEWEQWQAAKIRNIKAFQEENRRIFDRREQEIEKMIDRSINGQYEKKLVSVQARLPETAATSGIEPEAQETSFFHVNDRKIAALAETVKNDLAKAEDSVLRKTDDIYRKIIFNAEAHMATGAKTVFQAADLAAKSFLAQGINSIVYKDKDGNSIRVVNIASYAEMALRTASHRAILLAEGKQRDLSGDYLVVVSAHANTCEKCAPWQSQVLVDDVFTTITKAEAVALAKEKRVSLLSEAIEAGLLHPNCRHSISTFIEGVTAIPIIPDVKDSEERYKAEQKQRHLESEIRKWKRIEEGSLDDINRESAEKKVKKAQKKMREHLKKYPHLRRIYAREK